MLRGFLPDEVLSSLIEGNQAEIEPKARLITVGFWNISGYVALSEKMSPEAVMKLIGTTFGIIEQGVRANGGIIDKFIGDSVMALWNTPHEISHHETSACLAALEVRNAIERLGSKVGISESPVVRVGIASGRAVVGIMQFGSRRHFT